MRCQAKVERFGSKGAYRGPPIVTLLLVHVMCVKTGALLTDHLWMRAGKWSQNIRAGDTIEFDARSAPYEKGYRGRREDEFSAPVSTDYGLARPTNVRIVGKLRPPAAGPQNDLFAGALA